MCHDVETVNSMSFIYTHTGIICHSFSKNQVAESSLAALQEEHKNLTTKVGELEGTVKKLNQEGREKPAGIGVEGLSRIEVARVLRERNEYKEKYLSLLEQTRCVHLLLPKVLTDLLLSLMI